MNKPLTVIEHTNEQVILKNNIKEPLDVARYPFLDAKYDYITVTKGEKHILTVVKSDGTTFSFHWGVGGYTLISENLKRLKKFVTDFIVKNGIPFEVKTAKPPCSAIFYYNDYYKMWQASLGFDGLSEKENYWSKDAVDVETLKEEVEKIYGVNFGELSKSIAQTGIPLWKALAK